MIVSRSHPQPLDEPSLTFESGIHKCCMCVSQMMRNSSIKHSEIWQYVVQKRFRNCSYQIYILELSVDYPWMAKHENTWILLDTSKILSASLLSMTASLSTQRGWTWTLPESKRMSEAMWSSWSSNEIHEPSMKITSEWRPLHFAPWILRMRSTATRPKRFLSPWITKNWVKLFNSSPAETACFFLSFQS